MSLPQELKYAKTHEWVQFLDDTTVRIGLTAHAAEQMGDLVYLSLPEEGDEVAAGESLGDIESVKTVSDLYSPVTGKVSAVNADVADDPAKINENAFESWILEVNGVTSAEELMDAAAYEAFVASEA